MQQLTSMSACKVAGEKLDTPQFNVLNTRKGEFHYAETHRRIGDGFDGPRVAGAGA